MNKNYYVSSEKLSKSQGKDILVDEKDILVDIKKIRRFPYKIMNCCEEALKKTLHLIPRRTIEEKV